MLRLCFRIARCLLLFAAIPAQGASAALDGQTVNAAVEVVAPSVVRIHTVGGLERIERQLTTPAPTTGLVISADGYILASSFQLASQPSSILVVTASGEQGPAELVATDHSRKLVLLRARGLADLPVPTFATADEVQVGAWAIAVGRTVQSQQPNLSLGVVSARNRIYGRALQTDAAVSPANYGGPLIDLHGRVLGLLVPLSPHGEGAVAGVEWYDSGVGFAVPIGDIGPALERMKAGADQHAGQLGIAMASGNAFIDPAKIAAVRPNSPAARAGFAAGDRIVMVERQTIRTINDLRFALGPRYAGDAINVTVARDDETIAQTIALSGPLGPFRHAFLGLLPMRALGGTDVDEADQPAGVEVRHVYLGSPASQEGILAGDRIVRIGTVEVATPAAAIDAMNGYTVGDAVPIEVERGNQSLDVEVTAKALPVDLPPDLPPAHDAAALAGEVGEDIQLGARELNLPEFANACQVFVPDAVGYRIPSGVIVILADDSTAPRTALQTWEPLCQQHDLLVAIPSPTDEGNWSTRDAEYLVRLLMTLTRDYPVDRSRIVVAGQGRGVRLAARLAFGNSAAVTGLALMGAPLPRGIRPPDATANRRLAVCLAPGAGTNQAAASRASLRQLREAGYNTTQLPAVGVTGTLEAEHYRELARWTDTLDRF